MATCAFGTRAAHAAHCHLSRGIRTDRQRAAPGQTLTPWPDREKAGVRVASVCRAVAKVSAQKGSSLLRCAIENQWLLTGRLLHRKGEVALLIHRSFKRLGIRWRGFERHRPAQDTTSLLLHDKNGDAGCLAR